MTTNIVPIGQQVGALSASMRQRMAAAALVANKSFTSGVTASYPLLSIRGKEFTFRLPDGREQRHQDQNGIQIPFIDVILVDASPNLAKAYYAKGYDPSEFTRPDCWSLDSVKPDPSAPSIQSPVCGNCIQNQFGSKITDAGKKAKACQDHRRMVVMLPHQVGQDNAALMVMRVPQSSLKNLKAHAEVLGSYGIDTKACITRMSFTTEAFPQLAFTYVNLLTEDQWDWVQAQADSPKVKGMLMTPDFENAVSTPVQQTPRVNAGLQALPAAPIPAAFEKLLGEEAEEQEEDHPALPMEARADVIIDLPDGKRFNQTTGQYIEAEPEPPAPVVDPNVVVLPDGKFFNMLTKQYVAGNTVETATQTVAAPEVKAKPKKVVKPKEEPAPVDVGKVVQEAKPVSQDVPSKPNGSAAIVPAPDALEAMLKDVLPQITK